MTLRNLRTVAGIAGAILVATAITVILWLFLTPLLGQAGAAVVSLAVGIGVGHLLSP